MGDVIRNRNACKAIAIVESTIADVFNAIWNRDLCQIFTPRKCTVADADCVISQCYGSCVIVIINIIIHYPIIHIINPIFCLNDSPATIECIRADADDAIWYCDVCNVVAIAESIRADGGDAIWNYDASQTGATRKCAIADACYTIWNIDARKVTAAIERIIADIGNAIGYCDARQTTATRERIIADARYTI